MPAGSGPFIGCLVSCSGVYDALADTGDDITAEVGQADRYECPEPQGKLFHWPAEISHGSGPDSVGSREELDMQMR